MKRVLADELFKFFQLLIEECVDLIINSENTYLGWLIYPFQL